MPSRLEMMLQTLAQKKTQLRDVTRAAQNRKRRSELLSSVPVVRSGEDLAQNLSDILPAHLVPGNAGRLNDVAWFHYYPFEFDFGTDPTYASTSRLVDEIQVAQEAAFIFTDIIRHADEYSTAGDLAPLQIEIRDLQSSRFFNNAPIPIQMIGQKGYYTPLPAGFYVQPSARLEIAMTSWLDPGVTQATSGSGKHTIVFGGWRTRIEDAEYVLSTLYGGGHR